MYYQDLKRKYDNSDTKTIKANLKRIIQDNNIKNKTLQKILKCSIHTIYGYFKNDYGNKPEIITLLIIAEYLKIDVENFLGVYEGKICKVEGCYRQAQRLGMCHKHSARIYRNGDLEVKPKHEGKQPVKFCSIEGCNNKHFAKGLCNKHYARFKRHGDANIVNNRGKKKLLDKL